MKEYIERDVAIAALTEFCYDQTVSKYSTARHCLVARRAIEGATKVLESLPAADVEPVVRCKDCNHCDPENHHCDHYMGTAAPLRRKSDDFCSYGERKEGAD